MHLDQDMYGTQNDPINMALRRYAGMALTNLTFGDVVNKVQTGSSGAVSPAGTRDQGAVMFDRERIKTKGAAFSV